MDFNRNSSQQPVHATRPAGVPSEERVTTSKAKKLKANGWLKIAQLILLFSATVLFITLTFLIYRGGPAESKNVDTSKFQAVFLNGGVTNGQVLYSTYFGHLTAVNSQFFVLRDVYYITTTQATGSTNTSIQLTKLGCQQLHAPYDYMIINRAEVAFWENLQPSGQVAQAIGKYQQQNPNGPNCTQSSTTTTPSTPTTNTPNNTTTTPTH